MSTKRHILIAALFAVPTAFLVASAPAAAQTYDVPAFQTPYGESGLGLYMIFPNEVDDVGVMGTWRQAGATVDIGLRAGVLDVGDDLGLFGGVDLSNELVRHSDDFPLDIGWASGIGLGGVPDRDVGLLRIPFGFSLGRAVTSTGGEVGFLPYVYPRVALDFLFREDAPGPDGGDGDRTDLHFDVDLGFDLDFQQSWKLRFAATLGHNEAVGAGLTFVGF